MNDWSLCVAPPRDQVQNIREKELQANSFPRNNRVPSQYSARPVVAAYRNVSGAKNVVELERLVDLGEPFGAVGGAAPAALVERQLELAQQTRNLLAGSQVA